MAVVVTGETLTIEQVVTVARGGAEVVLAPGVEERVRAGREIVDRFVMHGLPAYGVNTGFGALCDRSIPPEDVRRLQVNLVRSHASGAGEPFPADVVRAAMLLRINSLCRGHSGVRPELIRALLGMLNSGVIPVVPSRGSVGASGDLAPLAHLALVLLGEGQAYFEGQIMESRAALARAGLVAAGLAPLELEAKEGLALLNGTSFMTALAALTWHDAATWLEAQNAAAALSLEAFCGDPSPYAESLLAVRPHPGAAASGRHLRHLLADGRAPGSPCTRRRIQDPYSFRCVPHVHGAAMDALLRARQTVEIEVNSTTDNPLILDENILSGGNFHGQPIAAVMDYLAIAATSVAAMAERRVNQLLHPAQSGLPAFLATDPGVNSGLMIAQYTAAALVGENRVLATPASTQSIPVCADQEDHVSMGTHAARKAMQVVHNCITVTAIELMAAAQALDLRHTAPLGEGTRVVYRTVRGTVPFVHRDTPLHPLISALHRLIAEGALADALRKHGFGLFAADGEGSLHAFPGQTDGPGIIPGRPQRCPPCRRQGDDRRRHGGGHRSPPP